MRIGQLKYHSDGTPFYDVPVGNRYRCDKCGKIIDEHIWIGDGWRGHVPTYSLFISNTEKQIVTHCSHSTCELNHRSACNGTLTLLSEGRNIDHNTIIKV